MRAQVSMEFIMIFTLVLFALTGFMFVISERMEQINYDTKVLQAQQLGESMVNEIVLASAMSNNYLRKFYLPQQINSRNYTIYIENGDTIWVRVFEPDGYYEEQTLLPRKIKGNFIDRITADESTQKHCVTRSDLDGVRISRNQLSIDPNVTQVAQGDYFHAFVSIFCVDELSSIQVTVEYDDSKLSFNPDEIEVLYGTYYEDYGPVFETIEDTTTGYLPNPVSGDPDVSVGPTYMANFTYYVYGYGACPLPGDINVVSGPILYIPFTVKNSAPIGKTAIRFLEKDNYGQPGNGVYNCGTGTDVILFDSQYGAEIEII